MTLEYLPMGHVAQYSLPVAPDDDENFPAPHNEHNPSPNTLYDPAEQDTQVVFTVPTYGLVK